MWSPHSPSAKFNFQYHYTPQVTSARLEPALTVFSPIFRIMFTLSFICHLVDVLSRLALFTAADIIFNILFPPSTWGIGGRGDSTNISEPNAKDKYRHDPDAVFSEESDGYGFLNNVSTITRASHSWADFPYFDRKVLLSRGPVRYRKDCPSPYASPRLPSDMSIIHMPCRVQLVSPSTLPQHLNPTECQHLTYFDVNRLAQNRS